MTILNYSEQVYRSSSGDLLEKVPRFKFNYTLIIDSINNNKPLEFLTTRDITLPNYVFDTEIVNQYNRKRVIQTRMNIEPMTVSFLDTYDNNFYKLITDYVRHYYNNRKGIDVFTDVSDSVITDIFETNMGLTPNDDQKYFFTNVKIRQTGLQDQYRDTILSNCMLINISNDGLAYASSEPIMWTVTFQPELLHVEQFPTPKEFLGDATDRESFLGDGSVSGPGAGSDENSGLTLRTRILDDDNITV